MTVRNAREEEALRWWKQTSEVSDNRRRNNCMLTVRAHNPKMRKYIGEHLHAIDIGEGDRWEYELLQDLAMSKFDDIHADLKILPENWTC